MIDMRIVYPCFFTILFLGCGAQHKINYTLTASGVYDDGFGHSYKSDQPLTAAPTIEYQIKEDVVGGAVKKVDIVFGINGDSASSFDRKTETVLAKLEDEYNFSFFIPYKRTS